MFWVIAALKASLNTTDVRRMAELRDAPVPEGFKEARIFLDHGPCSDVSDGGLFVLFFSPENYSAPGNLLIVAT